jgi:preprotein translocase SecE subunit
MKINASSVKDGISATKTFLKETRAEAKKVIWPGREYVTAATLIILFIVFVTGFFVTFLDYFFGKFFSLLIK